MKYKKQKISYMRLSETYLPEQKLWNAVIERALLDYYKPLGDDPNNKHTAKNYLYSERFLDDCEKIDASPERLIRIAKGLKRGTRTKRTLESYNTNKRNKIKLARVKANLKQKDVAEFLKIGLKTYSRLETGRSNFTKQMLEKLKELLEID